VSFSAFIFLFFSFFSLSFVFGRSMAHSIGTGAYLLGLVSFYGALSIVGVRGQLLALPPPFPLLSWDKDYAFVSLL
jgi:hypothetical protein